MVKFFNSLTRKKEDFMPHGDHVKMYSCGPTVYSYPHIGNMRAYLFMDNIRRVLKYNGYKLDGVINITDVGHLTSDADEGEDKMMVASQREHKSPWEIAKFYTEIFMQEVKRLNIDMPEHVVPATSVIKDIIAFVQGLLDKGYAYQTSKGIYFDINKFPGYGKLGGAVDQKKAGARIDVDDEKHSPYDFVLWVKAPKEHIMQWDSPWGRGYPGWHIECSVIGNKFLGEYIDIHTGGVDHKTIHHENEIAQSDSLCAHQVVKFWMHVEFLQVDGGKMGKSLNNMYRLDDLKNKGFDPEDFRYFYFMAHYSKQQNFTFEALKGAQNSLKAFKMAVRSHKNGQSNACESQLENYRQEFLDAVNDDLNMPKALAVCQKVLKEEKSEQIYQLMMEFNKILGFDFEEKAENKIPQEIEDLAKQRWQAKQNRDFAKADSMREELAKKGYVVKDSKDGYVIEKA